MGEWICVQQDGLRRTVCWRGKRRWMRILWCILVVVLSITSTITLALAIKLSTITAKSTLENYSS